MSVIELDSDLEPVTAVDRVRAGLDGLGARPTPAAVLGVRVADAQMGQGWRLLACGRFLAMRLARAWADHGRPPPPVDLRGDPAAAARRLVATRCLYGLAPQRASVTAARGLLEDWAVDRGTPPICVDHAIRRGDRALGFTLEQLAAFDPRADRPAHPVIGPRLDAVHLTHRPLRRAILEAAPWDARAARAALRVADEHLDDMRLVGDVLAGWTLGSRAARASERMRRLDALIRWFEGRSDAAEARLRRMQAAVRRRWATFHWPSEFSELAPEAEPEATAAASAAASAQEAA